MVPRFATLGRIPKGVWVLGGVSLLMDVSSEMIHSLLPLFMAYPRRQRDNYRSYRGTGGSHRPDPEGLLRRNQRLCRQA